MRFSPRGITLPSPPHDFALPSVTSPPFARRKSDYASAFLSAPRSARLAWAAAQRDREGRRGRARYGGGQHVPLQDEGLPPPVSGGWRGLPRRCPGSRTEARYPLESSGEETSGHARQRLRPPPAA